MAGSRELTEFAGAAGRTVRVIAIGIASMLALSGSAHAAARSYTSRNVGDWTVAASENGKGCFLTRQFARAGETTLLFGMDVDGTNHLTILNANWSIKPREELKLTFRLSSGSYPKHFAIGLASEGKRGFVTSFEPRFASYFAASRNLRIFRGNVPVERLSLDGSGAAVAELRKCVDTRRAEPAAAVQAKQPDDIPLDPFAPAGKRKARK